MSDDENDWCVGHKDILCFMQKKFNITTWRTVRAWVKAGMPFRRLWNGKPYVLKSEVIMWQLKRNE